MNTKEQIMTAEVCRTIELKLNNLLVGPRKLTFGEVHGTILPENPLVVEVERKCLDRAVLSGMLSRLKVAKMEPEIVRLLKSSGYEFVGQIVVTDDVEELPGMEVISHARMKELTSTSSVVADDEVEDTPPAEVPVPARTNRTAPPVATLSSVSETQEPGSHGRSTVSPIVLIVGVVVAAVAAGLIYNQYQHSHRSASVASTISKLVGTPPRVAALAPAPAPKPPVFTPVATPPPPAASPKLVADVKPATAPAMTQEQANQLLAQMKALSQKLDDANSKIIKLENARVSATVTVTTPPTPTPKPLAVPAKPVPTKEEHQASIPTLTVEKAQMPQAYIDYLKNDYHAIDRGRELVLDLPLPEDLITGLRIHYNARFGSR